MFHSLLLFLSHNPVFAGGAGIGLFGGVLAAARNVPSLLWNLFLREVTATVTVTNDDPAFSWFKEWMEEHPYSAKARTIVATVGESKMDDLGRTFKRLGFTPGFGRHLFFYHRHIVWLDRDRKQQSNVQSQLQYETISLRVVGRNKKLLIDLCKEIEAVGTRKRSEGFIDILVNRFGGWRLVIRRKARGLESVILDDDTGIQIAGEIRSFLCDQPWYTQMGIPHKRGYLFYGPPGGGKSSLALALSGELLLDIHILSLADKSLSDADLVGLLMKVGTPAIVLMEDVDAIFDESRKKQAENGADLVTFSGLLNALDGVASKEGIILMMSTNHPERLDPALIRPGRVDRQIEFRNASTSQLERLYCRFFPEGDGKAFAATIGDQTISMADAQEHLLKYRHDSHAALEKAKYLVPKIPELSTVRAYLPCTTD